jgi:flagellar secretion chaperone FliS
VKKRFRSQYREAHLSSMSAQEAVVMLYDGAIGFMKEAITELGQNNLAAKVRLVEKVSKIIEYLHSCLDTEKGGEIAENLGRLYEYMLVRLTEANLNNDTAKMEEVIRLLGTVREGWAGIYVDGRKTDGQETVESDKGTTIPKPITVSV